MKNIQESKWFSTGKKLHFNMDFTIAPGFITQQTKQDKLIRFNTMLKKIEKIFGIPFWASVPKDQNFKKFSTFRNFCSSFRNFGHFFETSERGGKIFLEKMFCSFNCLKHLHTIHLCCLNYPVSFLSFCCLSIQFKCHARKKKTEKKLVLHLWCVLKPYEKRSSKGTKEHDVSLTCRPSSARQN